MSGAARRARQLRRKPSSTDDDSGDEAGGSGVRPPAPPARRPSALSFGDDEAGPAVKPRKKDRVRASGLRVGGEAGGGVAARSKATGERKAEGGERGGFRSSSVSRRLCASHSLVFHTHPGEYTAERLAELASAHARPPAPRGGTDATPADEPVFQLAGSFKATALGGGGGGGAGGVEAAGGDSLQDAPPAPPSSLPDAATIAAARAARERARRGEAAADDFIPLEGGGGRRPRDARLAFGVGADRARALAPLSDDDDDDEDFVRRQMAAGVATGAPGARVAASSSPPPHAAPAPPRSAAATAAALDAAADAVLDALDASASRARAAADAHDAARVRAAASLAASRSARADAVAGRDAAAARYASLQEVRDYVAALADALAVKSPVAEELEEHGRAAAAARGDAARERAAADDADEFEPVAAGVAVALGALARGAPPEEVAAVADAAATAAEATAAERAAPDAPPDEFGRDVRLAAAAGASARAASRAKRRVDEEGDATTDESDSETARAARSAADVAHAASTVFADTDDAFSSLDAVAARLHVFKEAHPDAYSRAYVADTAPALFAPFIRLALLSWDPLNESAPSFDAAPWVATLAEYGVINGVAGEDDAALPRLVADIALPALSSALSSRWTPRSPSASRAAARALADMAVYVPPSALDACVQIVRDRLASALAGPATLPPWPPAALAAWSRGRRLAARLAGRARRLVASAAAFEGVLPQTELAHWALSGVVARQLLPHARGAPDTAGVAARLARVLEVVPAAWFEGGERVDAARTLADETTRALAAAAGSPEAGALEREARRLDIV